MIFSNLNCNFSIFLDLRNLQEQVKKAFCYQKLFWPFTAWINCSSDLKNFENSLPSASNFKSFFSITRTILVTKYQIFHEIVLFWFSYSYYRKSVRFFMWKKEYSFWKNFTLLCLTSYLFRQRRLIMDTYCGIKKNKEGMILKCWHFHWRDPHNGIKFFMKSYFNYTHHV